MRNSQPKPGYNVQIGVNNEYIRLIEAYADRNDINTFEPFLESYHEMHDEYPLYPVADAGYGRYDKYYYCEKKGAARLKSVKISFLYSPHTSQII